MDKLYFDTFVSQSGQAVLADLREAFYDRPMFHPGEDSSGLSLAFREGQRSVVLDILARIESGRTGNEDKPTMAID